MLHISMSPKFIDRKSKPNIVKLSNSFEIVIEIYGDISSMQGVCNLLEYYKLFFEVELSGFNFDPVWTEAV